MPFAEPLRDPYLIALRSVTLPTHPPSDGYTRGEVICAGFTIREESSSLTKVGRMLVKTGSVCFHVTSDRMCLLSDHLLQPGHTWSSPLHLHRYRRLVLHLLQHLLRLQPLPGGQQGCSDSLIPVTRPHHPRNRHHHHHWPVTVHLLRNTVVHFGRDGTWCFMSKSLNWGSALQIEPLHVSSRITRYGARLSTVSE